MTGGPAISVVVPTHNRAAVLDRLLENLAKQDPPVGGFEVIVVDDGSTDETASVVHRHTFARYLHQANAGPAAARNRGWRAAQAPLVAFTDDDTVPGAHWLTELCEAFEARAGLAAAGGRIVALVPSFLATFVQLERHIDHGVDPDLGVRYLVTANAVWRRTALCELDGFDETFSRASGEDTDLSMRALAQGFELAVLDDGQVAHDHRTSLRGLLRTYHKHGQTRAALVRRHPDQPWGRRSRIMLLPRYWGERFRYYRAHDISAPSSLVYLVLHFVGLVSYALGMARSRWHARGRAATA